MKRAPEVFRARENESEESWMSVSDMMAGLMIVFLFIAIALINNIGQHIDDTERKICAELSQEFEREKTWNITICKRGVGVSFDESLGFEKDSDKIKPEFKEILSSFYPRLMRIMWNNKAKVSQLRIEGHTSSVAIINKKLVSATPSAEASAEEKVKAYLYNAGLSQRRSKKVLEFVLEEIEEIKGNGQYADWSIEHVTAHGLSSSKRIETDETDEKGKSANRRVEFVIETTAFRDILSQIRVSE